MESNTDNNQFNTPSISVPPVEVKITSEKTTTKTSTPPPLFSFQLTNPITYLKAWWKKVVGNEGIKLTLQIKPLTAIFMVTVFSGLGFSFGRLTVPEVLVRYLPYPSPLASPQASPEAGWKDTAFTGKLQYTSNKYFLVTTSAEAITLEVPATINLNKLIGKRILVVGRYHKDNKYLVVADVSDMEILPTSPVPLPTISPLQ